MKSKLAVILMGIMGVIPLIPPQSAFAADCSQYTCTLDVWNTLELAASGDYVTVSLNADLDELTFTYNDVSGSPDPDLKNLKTIGWNIDPNTNESTSGYTLYPGSKTLNGFGTFETVWTKDDVSGVQSPTSVTFTNFSANSLSGATFAIHMQYQNGCSGFVGNGYNAGGKSNPYCGSVPEPTSMMLLGAGLAGIGIWRRKSAQI